MDHSVTTAAVPREWFVGFVAGLFDAVTKRAVDGVMTRPDFVLRIGKWSRTGVVSGELESPEGGVIEFELLTVSAPQRLRLVSESGGLGFRGSANVDEWTAEGRLSHRWFTAELSALVADVHAPRWGVVVRMDIVGKGLGRVVWPLARIFAYDRLRRRFQAVVEEAAASWDAAAADLLRRHPSDAAESLLNR